MSRKSYSLFVVVIVVAALALSQLACSGSGGGGDTSMPSGCQPGMAQTHKASGVLRPRLYPRPLPPPRFNRRWMQPALRPRLPCRMLSS